MATTRQYWNAFKATRNTIAIMMGVDATLCGKEIRAVSNADLAAIAIVVKALTDKGVLTDADLQAARTNALGPDGSTWDDEPF